MIGGDMLLNDYKFTVGSDRELFHVDHNPINWVTAMSIMFCMMTGNDANFMDVLFDYGIINVILMRILAAFLNILASYFFIYTWRFNFGNQYADIVKDTFGWGHNTVRIIYILTLVYSAIANISSLKTTLQMFIHPIYGDNTIFTNKYFVFFFITPLFTLPFVFFKKFVSLRFYFMIGDFAILTLLIGTIYFFVTSFKQEGFDPQKNLF